MSGTTLFVSNAQELTEAYELLSNTAGGGTIQIAADAERFDISLEDGGSEHVTITSANPDDPFITGRIRMLDVENVTVDSVEIDSTGTEVPVTNNGFFIGESSGITLSNITAEGNATGYYDPDDPNAVRSVTFGSVRGSDNIRIENVEAFNYFHGLTISESTNIQVLNNEFSGMQGDGLRMAGVQDSVVSGNYFHDFYGSDNAFNHDDMIQVWSTNAQNVTRNLEISNNILDSGSGPSSQSIFIRNETFDRGVDDSHIFENITITNNLIYNSHYHGISVLEGVDGVTISENTVLWNQGDISGGHQGAAPRIHVRANENVTVTNNVTSALSVSGQAEISGNYVLDYNSPWADNYVGNHLINALSGDEVSATEILMRPDSDQVGNGSEQIDPLSVSPSGVQAVIVATVNPEDPDEVTYDAGFSVDEQGFTGPDDYTYLWHFSDGTTQEGIVVTQDFNAPGPQTVELEIIQNGIVVAGDSSYVVLKDSTLMHFDFEDGATDASSFDTELHLWRGAQLVDNPEGGTALRIGGEDGDDYAITDLDADHFHDLQSFSLSMDMMVADDSSGHFLRFGHTMIGNITQSGEVEFTLKTDAGKFTVRSGDTLLNHIEMQNVMISYSNAAEILQLSIDGVVVDEIAASGIASPNGTHSVMIGSAWNSPVDALVDNFHFSIDPHDAVDPTPEEQEEEVLTDLEGLAFYCAVDVLSEPSKKGGFAPTEMTQPANPNGDFPTEATGADVNVVTTSTEQGDGTGAVTQEAEAPQETLVELEATPEKPEINPFQTPSQILDPILVAEMGEDAVPAGEDNGTDAILLLENSALEDALADELAILNIPGFGGSVGRTHLPSGHDGNWPSEAVWTSLGGVLEVTAETGGISVHDGATAPDITALWLPSDANTWMPKGHGQDNFGNQLSDGDAPFAPSLVDDMIFFL